MNELSSGHTIETDVCIVGAGAAGISLALELRNQSFDVALLESGGEKYDRATQALYQGENVLIPPVDRSRLRWFGGTTNAWAGRCRAFDAIDFETRDWVPNSGWPFDLTHLAPYYERAREIAQSRHDGAGVAEWESEAAAESPLPADRVHVRQLDRSPRVNFGAAYRPIWRKRRI